MDEQLVKSLATAFEKQTRLLEILASKEMATKAPAAGTMAPGVFTPTGIFNVPGVDRDVITAYVRPMGIANRLPMFPGNEDNPRYALLTGFTATSGERPTNPCDDSPVGFMKGCMITARFGRDSMSTNTINIDDVKRKLNRGIFDDLILHGRVLGLTDLVPSEIRESDVLNIITMSEMVTAVINLERDLTQMMWQGDPAVATAGGGYVEFPGLDRQITTGIVDAESGGACSAIDSDVKDFGYDLVGGDGRDIVEYMSMLEYYIYNNAFRMGLLPATWTWVIRPELWAELTAVWPCAYNTTRCTSAVGANATVVLDGRENIRDRDAMRSGMSITVNGRAYPVVVDDGIFEHTNITNGHLNPGEFASSIYFLPLTVIGGFPVTYMQHVDYRTWSDDVRLLRGTEPFWTDRGIFSWVPEYNKWCYNLHVKIQPRVVLRTPHLAGRIDHVKYSPLQHLRSPFPDDPYNKDGGVSIRPDGSTTYSVWLSR